MNLPNSITLGRIFLVPLLVVVLLTSFDGRQVLGISNEMLGAAIFGLASLTDWLDGFLARRRGQVTGIGQWMDPLADKLLVTAALISLVQLGRAPAWMVAVILGREFSVTVLRSMIHARGQSLPASPLGKIKMAAQVTAILLLILAPHMPELFVLGQVALWIGDRGGSGIRRGLLATLQCGAAGYSAVTGAAVASAAFCWAAIAQLRQLGDARLRVRQDSR